MRRFFPSPSVTSHDHFFPTFARFEGTAGHHLGEWLDEVATRAGRQNEQYVELMHTPDFSRVANDAYQIGWRSDLKDFATALLAGGISHDSSAPTAEIHQARRLRTEGRQGVQHD